MARRRKSNSTAEEAFHLFHELFLHVPAWVCFPVALIVLIGAKILIFILGSTNPFFQAVAVQYRTLFAGLIGGMVLLAGGTAAIKKGRDVEAVAIKLMLYSDNAGNSQFRKQKI